MQMASTAKGERSCNASKVSILASKTGLRIGFRVGQRSRIRMLTKRLNIHQNSYKEKKKAGEHSKQRDVKVAYILNNSLASSSEMRPLLTTGMDINNSYSMTRKWWAVPSGKVGAGWFVLRRLDGR